MRVDPDELLKNKGRKTDILTYPDELMKINELSFYPDELMKTGQLSAKTAIFATLGCSGGWSLPLTQEGTAVRRSEIDATTRATAILAVFGHGPDARGTKIVAAPTRASGIAGSR